MRTSSVASLAIAIAALTLIAGCVGLDGQRISWFFDEAKDELRILLHYDEMHDSGDDEHGNGAEQVRDFVGNGDFMLMDWFFHIDRNEIAKDSNHNN